jgi:hypothetical protein
LKRKFAKILGVGLTIVLLTSLMVVAVPALADVTQPTVTIDATENEISDVDAGYAIRFKLGVELAGSSTATFSLPDTNDQIVITAVAATDVATLTVTAGSVSVAMSGSGTYTASTGVIAFAAIGETATVTATADGTAGTWAQTAGSPTAAAGTDVNQTVALGTLAASGDTITIVLPPDTTVVASPTVTVLAGPGWVNSVWQNAVIGTPSIVGTPDTRTVVITHGAGGAIGEGAEVRIKVDTGITNPTAAGSYTLTVKTSKETTAVTSASYSIIEPTIGALPGIVSLYNPSGVLMDQDTGGTAIYNMIHNATAGFIVEIGPGTYEEDPDTENKEVTIRGAGAASEVIVIGDWTIDVDKITVDNLKIQGTVTVTSDDVVVKNCLISHESAIVPAAITTGMVDINAGADDVTVQDCTIDATAGTVADVGIDVAAGDVLITGCIIDIDAGNTTTADTAINVSGIAEVDATNNTITGASGTGYNTATGIASKNTISENTFDSLHTAVKINGAVAEVSSNLMQNGTVSTGATATTAQAQVDIVSVNTTGSVLIQGNDIENNAGYSVTVRDDADQVNVVGNYFSGNTYGLQNLDTATGHTLKAMLNYWGDSSGPTHSGNLAGTGDAVSDDVSYKPYATATVPEVSTATLAAAGTMDRSTTVGISFTTNNAAGAGSVTLARYSANPAISEPRYAVLANAYYDVYAPDITGGTQTILFYNANIGTDTVAYYYSTLSQSWIECSDQGVAGNLAYVIVTVGVTGTDPTNADLAGTPFVLVTVPPSPTVTIESPGLGDYDIPINPMFTWDVVPTALRYELTLSEDPTFAIIEWSYNVETNFYKATDSLRYSTTYYWRVRALTGEPYQVGPSWVTPSGPWSTGIFTTVVEPEEVAEEEPTQITVETPDVTITPGEVNVDVEPAVPDYLLWTIAAIGAVLVIALIVLIVRTRRVA